MEGMEEKAVIPYMKVTSWYLPRLVRVSNKYKLGVLQFEISCDVSYVTSNTSSSYIIFS